MSKLHEFKNVIKIEVEVNSIYEKLKAEFPEDYKHRELLAHAIIGNAEENGGLTTIYNALNGFDQTINFEIGDAIICTEDYKSERYDANGEDENGIMLETPVINEMPNWKFRSAEVGSCKIVDINIYKMSKIKIEFYSHGRYDKSPVLKTEWVNHKTCTKIGGMASAELDIIRE